MKGGSTRILLISIPVLIAFIWIQEIWRAKVPSRESERVKLFDLNIETLTSLEFQYTNLVIECVKENGVWMTGSSELGLGRADVALVHRLVAGLNSLGKGTTITAEHLEMRGFDASEYGLEKPSLHIRAADNWGQHSWLVGFKAALGEMLYVKEGEGDDIYTLSDDLLDIVPTEVAQLRDRVVFSGGISGVRNLEIRGPGGFVQLLKDTKGRWQIQQPVSAAADPQVVEDVLEELYQLRVEDFVADNVSDFAVYGLQGETQQISIGGGDGTSRMLVIGDEITDRPGEVYARRADDTSVFALKTKDLNLLDANLNDFRDARVLPLPIKNISFISVSRGTELLELVLDESSRWTITKPVTWNADSRAVADLLELWDIAVITEFNETNTTVEAEWTLQFGSAELGQTNRIGVLPTLGERDGLRIIRDSEPAIFQINLPLIPETILDPLQYKDRQLWKLRKEEIQKVSLEKAEEPRQVIARQAGGTFAPEGSNGSVRIDHGAVGELLNELAAVSTMGYVTYNPRDLSIYGLANPSVILHVGLAGTNQLGRVLLVGQEAAQGYYAMVQGRDVVFLLDKAVVNTLSRNLLVAPETAPSDVE